MKNHWIWVATTLAVAGCANGEPNMVRGARVGLAGTGGTVSTADGTTSGGVTTRTVSTGFAVPGATGASIDPSDYALCGLTRIEGYFDEDGAAQIVENGGWYEVVVSKDSGQSTENVVDWRCLSLGELYGLPDPSTASSAAYDVEDYGGSSNFEPTMGEMDGLAENRAGVWAGFQGAFSDFVSPDVGGTEWNLAEVGAVHYAGDYMCARANQFSAAGSYLCQDYDPGLDVEYRFYDGHVYAKTALGEDTYMRSYAFMTYFSSHEVVREKNYDGFAMFDNDELAIETSDIWCVIAGISGGGIGESGPGSLEIALEEVFVSGVGDTYVAHIDGDNDVNTFLFPTCYYLD